ncbi:anti-sigma factor family protein [Actinomadura viridis]|uniref:anti-sigma factor family protein n=1 Tax=Actinomadura viridis TaxID=58110 RepID=UPI003693BFEB
MNPAHYDYDALADLAEGLLEADEAASVTAHLDTCADCRERSADLADVSRILAEAPVPSMPAELASRIDSAIAAESLDNATVVSLERRRGRRHWRILSAAAATVIVLGGGAMAATVALDGSDSHENATAPALDRGDRGGGSPSTLVAPGETGSAAYQVTRSRTHYRATTLDRQVDDVLNGPGPRAAGAAPDARLAECVAEVARGRAPALVDSARYEGAPATVIAAPATEEGALDVWVVGPGCSAQDTKVIKHITAKRN